MKKAVFSLLLSLCLVLSTLCTTALPASATENESQNNNYCEGTHIWGEWNIDQLATLTDAGTKLRTCQECGMEDQVQYTITDCGTTGEVEWSFGEGVLYITGEGKMGDYGNTPAAVAPWQIYRHQITSVVIDNGVTYVGNRAFKNINSILDVTFGADVKSTGYECFYGCTNLEEVNLNDGIEDLGSLLFYNCSSLKEITLPNSINKLSNRVFKASGLISVDIPDAVTYCGYEVFMNCTSLENVLFSAGANTINAVMFAGCTALTTFTVPRTVGRIAANAFQDCTSLEEVVFEDDDSLKSVSNGSNIASSAFDGCDKVVLKGWLFGAVYNFCASKGVAFQSKNSSEFKYSVNDDGKTITILKRRGTNTYINIPETIDGYTVTAIGNGAFRDDAYATRVTLPATLKTIGNRSFQNTKITSLVIPDSVTSIDYNAFQNCTELKGVSFGNGLTTIAANVFKDCSSLGEVYVSNTITSIRTNAFAGCTNIIIKTQSGSAAAKAANAENLTLKPVTCFDYSVNADGLTVTVTGPLDRPTDLVIPETINGYTVTAIGDSAFRDATYITSVDLPYTLKTIDGRAFQNTGLTEVVIPQAVTKISHNAFEDCANLTEVVFWETPDSISSSAFKDCGSLTIYGAKNSVVESFANNKGFTFVAGRKYVTNELPVININTNGQSITSKEDYVDMTFTMENCSTELTNVTGGVRLRGNSTFKYDKKPYRIKFDKKQSLFGLKKAKSWVLLAEYIDPSNLHNYTAFSLAAQMPGLNFTPTPHKVNVYVNGEFKGLYTLCEQIQENEGRVNIEMEDGVTEDMVELKDYNFLICMDSNVVDDPTAILDETYYYIPEHNRYFEIKYPEKADFPSDEQFDSFLAQLKVYTKEIMDAFKYHDVDKIKSEVNVESLVDHLIIDQIMGEVDHSSKSFYMYYTSTSSNPDENEKLNFGPIWDYDFSLYTNWTSKPNMNYIINDTVFYSNRFFMGIVEIPEFYEMVVERYEQYALPALTEYLENFDELVASMQESLQLNHDLWYEEQYGSEITEKNIAFLKAFLENRIKVLNKVWLGVEE